MKQRSMWSGMNFLAAPMVFLLFKLMALREPVKTFANLVDMGYLGSHASAFHITRKGELSNGKQQSERNAFQCFVFGSKKAGKSALLDNFLGRKFSEGYTSTTTECFAANVVHDDGGTKKSLILREIAEDEVEKVLSNEESLAACDVVILVYDSSDNRSWLRAKELLVLLTGHGEKSGSQVPCLLVAVKKDPCETGVDSRQVSSHLGVGEPMIVDVKLGKCDNFFLKIVKTAEHPRP